MIGIVCLDDRNGMLFHKRRQSRDREVIKKIEEICRGKILWISAFSSSFFEGDNTVQIKTDENFLENAGPGEFCFIEDRGLEEHLEKLEQLIVFRWNRKYPGDFYLDLHLEEWEKTETEEFPGNSHEKITKEVYGK